MTYTMIGDYRLPNILPAQEPEICMGKYARMRLNFLKQNRRVMYTNLKTSGSLNQHLAEIQETAAQQVERSVTQMAMAQGITEELKVRDQMQWVGLMGNIRQNAEEIVIRELIYN